MTVAEDLLTLDETDGRRVWRAGTSGRTVVGLAGPPTSALLFRHLARPLIEAGWQLALPELFHPPPSSANLDELARSWAAWLPPGAVLLAHGTAVPLALALAARSSRASLGGVVLLNGPLDGQGWPLRLVSGVATRAPRLLRAGLRERPFVRAMASSAALRRLVVNPYVMDRDIVAMLAAPLMASRAHRAGVVQYLASLKALPESVSLHGLPVLLVWGAVDGLFPLPLEPAKILQDAKITVEVLPGARHLYIEESPWLVSRHLLSWALENDLNSTTTSMSRSGADAGT